jgi:hypothetical protein
VELKSWERKYYSEGGSRPFIFFGVFGDLPTSPSVSRSKYRCSGVPEGITIHKYHDALHPEVRDGFLEGYVWDQLVGADPELAERTANAPECLVMRGEPKESRTLDFLRDVVGFITCLLDEGGLCVYEPQRLKWWSREEWRQKIFAADGPVPREHVVILVTGEDHPGRFWFHTRGLRQFGRPDLSIHHVCNKYKEAVIDLFNRLIEFQAFGGVIEEGREITMGTIPPGLRCYQRGQVDDPDFNNIHVEIVWPTES